jgi:hypothetical protein
MVSHVNMEAGELSERYTGKSMKYSYSCRRYFAAAPCLAIYIYIAESCNRVLHAAHFLEQKSSTRLESRGSHDERRFAPVLVA